MNQSLTGLGALASTLDVRKAVAAAKAVLTHPTTKAVLKKTAQAAKDAAASGAAELVAVVLTHMNRDRANKRNTEEK